MADDLKPIIIAVICIVASALISGIVVYNRFHSTQPKTVDIAKIPPTTTSISPSKGISIVPSHYLISPTSLPGTTDDVNEAMKTLDNFNKYLNEGEYDKAVELFDWESFPNPEIVFSGYYVPGNKAKTLANICKDPNFCLRFHKILKTRKASETEYWFTIQYQTKDYQLFVNSAHVSGTFVKNTDFLYRVKKRNGIFKVAEAPNFFNVEAE